MKGYKAFNKDMTCKGFQFKEGKTYKEKEAVCYESGFHFCENPLDLLNDYDLNNSIFREIEVLGKVDKEHDSINTQASTTKIKIGAKLDMEDFIKKSETYLMQNTVLASSEDRAQLSSSEYGSLLASSGYKIQLANSGYFSKLASSGDFSKLANSGVCSQLVSSGYKTQLANSGNETQLASSGRFSKLANSGDETQLVSSGDFSKLASSGDYTQLANYGDKSKLASTGDNCKLTIAGKNSVGVSVGNNGIIKGKKGTWIALAEYNEDKLVHFKTAQIDGKKLKEDTWYKLENKKFVEVKYK